MGKGNLEYAVLGFVSSSSDGMHGYRLKSEFEALCGDFWGLNYGKMYRVLDDLERCGQLGVAQEIQEHRPNRKVYRITDAGRQTLDDWLLQPVSEDPQPLRDELSVKLLFLGKANVDAISELITRQRGIYLTRLARLSKRRCRLEKSGYDTQVVGLVMDGAEMRVRADLGWLEHIERTVIRSF